MVATGGPARAHVRGRGPGGPRRKEIEGDIDARRRGDLRISGPIYGIRRLEAFRAAGVEIHLVISGGARLTIPLDRGSGESTGARHV